MSLWFPVRLVIGLLAIYLLVCLALFLVQRRLLFPSPPPEAVSPADRLVELGTGEGGAVFGLWYPPPSAEAPVVVHFHGNGEQLAGQSVLAEGVASRGVGFLAVEYPGYGPMSAQAKGEGAFLAAGRVAIAWLREAGVARERTVLSGRSLGTGVAVALASEGAGRRVVLVSPFTALVDVAAEAVSFLPVRLLLRDRFESASRAAEIEEAVLLVHGTQDEIVPFAMSERLVELFPDARLVPVEGRGHNDLPVPMLAERIADFAAHGTR